ncbi:hypothetical protein HPP92_018728 [Vanilla planifolia]|uniref:Uncharacterized protein n=1 Tax=Vanilla planifolia TaxID=51239 RepID=A0A835QE47_VANPL|nr:hypothetical protein HPP92_018728 [Vanilla planifolia]
MSPPSSVPKSFLKDVLKAVATKERWDPETRARLLDLDEESVRVGAIQSYEFHVRLGGAALVLKFSEETAAWRKARKGEVELGLDLLDGVVVGESKERIVELQLEGPLELLSSGGDDKLSVHFPFLNITRQGLRRVLVGEGISIKVNGAYKVSIFYPYDISFPLNGSTNKERNSMNQFWSLGFSCAPLVLVRIIGPALLVPSRANDRDDYIETSFSSKDTIELLPDKCYINGLLGRAQPTASPALTSRLVIMERILKSFFGKHMLKDRSTRLLTTKITSTNLLKFRIEVERDISESDGEWRKLPKWRTRPSVERTRFEIVARIEGGGALKPLIARKLSRPQMIIDSAPWSHLMYNISFTEFPSIVVPSEALTLDVKWFLVRDGLVL